MRDIRLHASIKFDAAVYDEVAAISAQNAAAARHHEGVIEHLLWVDESRTVIRAHEHYEDAEALMGHLKKLDGGAIGRLLEIATLETVTCYCDGDVDPRVIEKMGEFGVPVQLCTLLPQV